MTELNQQHACSVAFTMKCIRYVQVYAFVWKAAAVFCAQHNPWTTLRYSRHELVMAARDYDARQQMIPDQSKHLAVCSSVVADWWATCTVSSNWPELNQQLSHVNTKSACRIWYTSRFIAFWTTETNEFEIVMYLVYVVERALSSRSTNNQHTKSKHQTLTFPWHPKKYCMILTRLSQSVTLNALSICYGRKKLAAILKTVVLQRTHKFGDHWLIIH